MDSKDYPFDFAVRLDGLVVGCIEGGNKPEILREYLQTFVDNMDDSASSVSEMINRAVAESNQ